MVPELTLYSREYCHLCHDMIAALEVLQQRYRFSLTVVDVDADEALEERLGELVPVLMAGEVEICHYHLDLRAFKAFMESRRLPESQQAESSP
ncbi:MAG: glutaredoxin family protein [Pseudomonadota bacterium]